MREIRKEYSRTRQSRDKITEEAAYRFVERNVILINEKLNRKAVERLISSIQKFEDRFGPYKDRLPSIAKALGDAEAGLHDVITGKTTDKKATNLLKQLSFLYNHLSRFFSGDLPVILRTKLFIPAKENPEVRLNMIVDPEGLFKRDIVQDAIANAIRPTRKEKVFTQKVLKTNKLPRIDASQIAKEMMDLSYADFEELTKIGTVPLTATDDMMESKKKSPNS